MVDKDLLVFLHIFKTGGTSLYSLMSKVYGTGYVLANPPDIKRRVTFSKKALAGHIPLTQKTIPRKKQREIGKGGH